MSKLKRKVQAELIGWCLRIAVALVFVFAGVKLYAWLKSMRPEATLNPEAETAVSVDTYAVVREARTIQLQGFGTVEATRTVMLTSQLSGRIVAVAPAMEVGQVVPAGTVLFRIEDADFVLRKRQNETERTRLEKEVARLRQEIVNGERLLVNLEASVALSEQEGARLETLNREAGIVTDTELDTAKKALLADRERAMTQSNMLAIYPLQIEALEAQIARLDAQLELDDLNIARCSVVAPFTGRVLRKSVEVGYAVAPGQELVMLADDTGLEIAVPLDAHEVQAFMAFEEPADAARGWFPTPKPVLATIHWSDADPSLRWEGVVDRVMSFDRASRTAKVVVRIPLESAANRAARMTPVPGMFCDVAIPGVTIPDLVAVPREALRADSNVFAIKDGRLVSVPVELVRTSGEYLLVHADLADGQLVITNRMNAPVTGMLVAPRGPASTASAAAPPSPSAPASVAPTAPSAADPAAAPAKEPRP